MDSKKVKENLDVKKSTGLFGAPTVQNVSSKDASFGKHKDSLSDMKAKPSKDCKK